MSCMCSKVQSCIHIESLNGIGTHDFPDRLAVGRQNKRYTTRTCAMFNTHNARSSAHYLVPKVQETNIFKVVLEIEDNSSEENIHTPDTYAKEVKNYLNFANNDFKVVSAKVGD